MLLNNPENSNCNSAERNCIANKGKVLLFVAKVDAEKVLNAML